MAHSSPKMAYSSLTVPSPIALRDRSAANQDEEKETAGTARRPLETEKADRAYDEKKADRASSAANAESAQINLDKSALRAISDEVRDAVSPLRRETDRIGDSLYKMASKVDELAVKVGVARRS